MLNILQHFTIKLSIILFGFSEMMSMGNSYAELRQEMAGNFTESEQFMVLFNKFLCGNQSGDLVDQILGGGGKASQ